MKVSNNNSSSILAGLDKAKEKSASLDKTNIGQKNQIDASGASKLNVSARAQEVAKAKELATPSLDVDEAKVARLQSLIDSGQYKVDADAVADKLLTEHASFTE